MEHLQARDVRPGPPGQGQFGSTRITSISTAVSPTSFTTTAPPTDTSTETLTDTSTDTSTSTSTSTGDQFAAKTSGSSTSPTTTSLLLTATPPAQVQIQTVLPSSSITATISPEGAIAVQAQQVESGAHMSNGAVAAATVIPLTLLAILAIGIVLLRWKRKQKNVKTTAFVQDMAESRQPFHEHYNPRSIAAVPTPAYFTGLDTESNHASNTRFSDEPPPPYGRKQAAMIPLINEPDHRSSTQSASSWTTAPSDNAFLDTASARYNGRSDARSISSTAYSDDASLRSARAARMSMGSAQIITTNDRDPFVDPESPVSSVGGDETQALHTGDGSRAVSPMSFASRRNL